MYICMYINTYVCVYVYMYMKVINLTVWRKLKKENNPKYDEFWVILFFSVYLITYECVYIYIYIYIYRVEQ